MLAARLVRLGRPASQGSILGPSYLPPSLVEKHNLKEKELGCRHV